MRDALQLWGIPSLMPYEMRIGEHPFHVVEWRRCGAVKHDARCYLRSAHAGPHEADARRRMGEEFCWTEGGGGIGATAMEADPTWPVPCWVTTAADAEGWRVAPRRALERPEEWLPGDWAATDSEPGVPRQVVAVYRTSRWSDPPGDPLPVPILALVRSTRSAEVDEWPASRCRRVEAPHLARLAGPGEGTGPEPLREQARRWFREMEAAGMITPLASLSVVRRPPLPWWRRALSWWHERRRPAAELWDGSGLT